GNAHATSSRPVSTPSHITLLDSRRREMGLHGAGRAHRIVPATRAAMLAALALSCALGAGCAAAPPASAPDNGAWGGSAAASTSPAAGLAAPAGSDAAVRVVSPLSPDPAAPEYRNFLRPYLW